MRGAALAVLIIGLAGCGDVVHQTRYMPSHSSLSWDAEHEQLPWQEPALAETHYPRNGRPAKPFFRPEPVMDVEDGATGFHFGGDGDAADTGALEPIDLDR